MYLKRNGIRPEQVQDFYPTPGTISTVMYYTGIDPLTKKAVYCTNDYHEKQLQRALLQYNRPENAELVREAIIKCGRPELIGFGKYCLITPNRKPVSISKTLNFKGKSKAKNNKTVRKNGNKK